MTLTVKEIEAARHGVQKERMSDGGGLYLKLAPSGRKTFQVSVPKGPGNPDRVWVTLGAYPEVSLKAARSLAASARLWASEGATVETIRERLDRPEPAGEAAPSQGRAPVRRTRRLSPPAAPAKTADTPFRDVAQVWFERKAPGLRNPKHIAQNWTTLQTYVFPQLGARPIGGIEIRDVVETLRPIWHAKQETARRTLGRVAEVFELARLEYGVATNPARFAVDVAFGKVRRRTRHHGTLEPERMPDLWTWLADVNCAEDVRHLVMLMMLTAKRTGETRFAEWSFFSPGFDIWTTPEHLMKMSRPHRVPMSLQAKGVLQNMVALNGDRAQVFAKPRNRHGVICENTACNLVQRFDRGMTGHGIRAAFKTWARSRRIYQVDAIEMALAHEPDKLEAAYQRADLLEERAVLMQDWADFLTGGEAVRPLVEAT